MARTDIALGSEIKEQEVESLVERVDKNSIYINDIVDDIVRKHCQPLDDLMEIISETLGDASNPPTDLELDQMALKLPTTMYFVGSAQEALGIKEDVSQAIKLDIFNRVRLETTGTVADKDTKAALASQQEFIVNAIYGRAYKKVRQRLEIASDMLSSVKKVITRRMYEMQLSGMSNNTYSQLKILNDEGE